MGDTEELEWQRGIKIQKPLLNKVEERMTQLGMVVIGTTESIRYCMNHWLETTAATVNIGGKLS